MSELEICEACEKEVFERKNFWKSREAWIIFFGGLLLISGLYFEIKGKTLTAAILFVAVALTSGYDIFRKAIKSLFKRKISINLLVSIAAIGAFAISHAEEGAAVLYLFFIAEFLEDYASERAKESFSSLIKLAPEKATVKKHGKELIVHAHDVKKGEIVIVKPGEKIPVDGVVVNGSSHVDEAPITGESMPVAKSKDSIVFAGSINKDGFLEVRATKNYSENVISKVIKLVSEAQKEKSRTERFIDVFAGYYTPAIIILAAFIAIFPPLILNTGFEAWFYRALVLLVVACPCALAISTPVSMVSAITSAAKNGIWIKSKNYVEEIGKVKAIVFDKTGTLTKGKAEVADVAAISDKIAGGNDIDRTEIIKIACSLEAKSKHPIAEAIMKFAKENKISPYEIWNFKNIPGYGLSAMLKGKYDGKTFYIGNKAILENKKLKNRRMGWKKIREVEGEGKTVVVLSDDEKVIGVIGVRDSIRHGAKEAIEKLRERGIAVVMLTGDNENVARAIADELGIKNYHAELLPEDKVEVVEKLIREHKHIAFVGDGINDAPALAKASVGIAMGKIGSHIAIESGDIILMHDEIGKINYLINLSKKTMSVVKENVLSSISIKSFLALLAVLGFVSLWVAVAIGDMGLSLAVIINAMRIADSRL